MLQRLTDLEQVRQHLEERRQTLEVAWQEELCKFEEKADACRRQVEAANKRASNFEIIETAKRERERDTHTHIDNQQDSLIFQQEDRA